MSLFWDSVTSAWQDIKGLPAMIAKTSPGVPATPDPTYTAKPDDPYTYEWYMGLTTAKWTASADWITRKLTNDYAAGRFTESQYNQIVAKLTAINTEPSLSDLLKGIGKDVSKSAGVYAQSVADDVDANGLLGGGKSILMIVLVAVGGLLLLQIILGRR